MNWEIVATWIAGILAVGGMVFNMGKQAREIESQAAQIHELKEKVKAGSELPIKLAAVETDVKHVLKELTEIKLLLYKRAGGD